MSTENPDDEIIYYEDDKIESRTPRQRFFLFIADHTWQLFLLVFALAYANHFILQRAKNTGWSDSHIYSNVMYTMDFDSADHLWAIDDNNVVEISPSGDVSTYPLPSKCENANAITVRSLDEVWVSGKSCLQSFNPQAEPVSWTDQSLFFMNGKDLVDLTADEDGRIWVLSTEESSFSRFEDKVFLYRFADEKWNHFRVGDQHTYFRQAKALVVTHDGQICFKPSSWMQCRLPDGRWERDMTALWGNFDDLIEDEQGRLWGISNKGLTVCDEKCATYTLDNSGLKKRPYSMAFDSGNRLWLSNYGGLRILDKSKILPAGTLEVFVTANFVINYMLLLAGYLIFISTIDRNREHIPLVITVRYALGKLWLSWLLVGIIFAINVVGNDWNSAQSTRIFAGISVSIILVPIIRLVSLGVHSKISAKTVILSILLGLFIFIVVIGLPTGFLVMLVNMQ